jgi:glycosyltransferase involved in cell wall biosynthesis
MKVRFSVVMPVYNRQKYVSQAIDSVLSQTFTDFELIAVDDGSTDGSLDLLKSYGTRIRVIEQKNSGPEVARNTGVAAARGEYIALLDSDDLFFPTALETYDRVIRAFDSPPMVIGSEFYYRDGTPLPVQPLTTGPVEVLKFEDCLSKTVSLTIICSLFLIRKSVYEEIGGFRKSTAQTWYGDVIDFLLKLGTRGPFLIIRKPLTAVYRMHDANSVKSAKEHAYGMLGVARSERQGLYPGGRERRWDRYVFLGGICAQWAVVHCWRNGDRKTALRLLFGAAPMVAAAVWKRFWRIFRKPPSVIVLPEEQLQAESLVGASMSGGREVPGGSTHT